MLPHLAHLAPWCIALTRADAVLARAPGADQRALPSRWAVAGVAGRAVVLTLWTERTLFGKEAGVTMLVVLMALKTLELRARRDAMVVFFLGFFLVLTNFLYSQSLLTAAGDAGVGVGPADRAGAGAHAGGQAVAAPGRRGGGARRAAGRAADGGAVPAVPAHRPAVGHAAGRAGPDRAVGLDAHGRRWPRWPTTTRSPCACASTRPRAAARGDVLPRPGAVALRRQRVDAPAQPRCRRRRGGRAELRTAGHAGCATR